MVGSIRRTLTLSGLLIAIGLQGCGAGDTSSASYTPGGDAGLGGSSGKSGAAGQGGAAGNAGGAGSVSTGGEAGNAGAGGSAGGGGGVTGGSSGAGGTAGAAGSAGMSGAGGSSVTTHSLGGTVIALAGDKVVLRNNDGDDLTVAANGPFSFATPVAEGATYSVTVFTQPQNPSQNCSVDHGTGTMGQADVVDVTVTCADAGSFTVGGVVGGLVGSGLVLQNNSADALPIADNGFFTFATPVPSGQTYAVTVSQQPTNPDQTCKISSATGTVANANISNVLVSCNLKDTDGDKIPDISDPFPNDANSPKAGKPNTVYAHTSSELFTMDVVSHAITSVGTFHGSGFTGSMTDIALDEYAVLYGVTFDDLYVCAATNAECFHLATLPQSFNGLTMVPRGTLDPIQDALVGIANSGDWYRIRLTGTLQAQLTQIGSYGTGYTNAGDAFSIDGVGTFAAVNKTGSGSNIIVKADPLNGHALNELGPTTGYSSVWGLAGWQGVIFAFDEGGDVFSIDPSSAAIQLISHTSHAWWGAGVTTRL